MTRALRTAPAIAALVATGSAVAAPSLPVTRPPVAGPSAGPPIDPMAVSGQWFTNSLGVPEVRSHEFYDNIPMFGGGFASSRAIEGVIAGPGDLIVGPVGLTGFFLTVSITNDTPSWTGPWLEAPNSHGEIRTTVEPYEGKLFDTKLTVEFADDGVPGNFFPDPAGTGPESNIFAVDADQLAWFSFTTSGRFQVPTYDFGHIPEGVTVTRRLEFGLYTPVPFVPSIPFGTDLLLNRTTSLKISNYVEFDPLGILGAAPYFDTGSAYPDESGRSSNVSVFHNIPAPGSIALATLAGLVVRRRR